MADIPESDDQKEIFFGRRDAFLVLVWVAAIAVSAIAFSPFSDVGGNTLERFVGLVVLSFFMASVGVMLLGARRRGPIARASMGFGYGVVASLIVASIYAQVITPRGEASAWYAMSMIPCVFFSGLGGMIAGFALGRTEGANLR